MNKQQSEIVLIKLLEFTAKEQLPLILPYTTGFPGELSEAQKHLREVFRKKVSMEHNTF
jgi:hypothetical protein